MRRQITEKVPQVVGKRSELMELLIDEMPLRGTCGCDKFWMILNLPGCPGFGIMLSGEVWKGPMRVSTSDFERGPM